MVDEVFGVLAHSHRRRVLRTLLESDGTDLPLSLEDLLDGEHDPEAFTLEMTHRHLAKLADEGFVEWNPSDGEIKRGPKFDRVRPLLEFVDDHEAYESPP